VSDNEGRKARPWDLFNKNIGRVPDEIEISRMSICEDCDRLIKATKNCKECGCFMTAKTKLPNAECPLGKWGKIKIDITKEI
jgi:hypothetical protein